MCLFPLWEERKWDKHGSERNPVQYARTFNSNEILGRRHKWFIPACAAQASEKCVHIEHRATFIYHAAAEVSETDNRWFAAYQAPRSTLLSSSLMTTP